MRASLVLILLAACGDDSGGQQPPAPGQPGSATGANANATPKAQLQPRVHIEDRVPEAERGTIRHRFNERDFESQTNRDPFLATPLVGDLSHPLPTGPAQPVTPTIACRNEIIAPNYSYADLKLVGIVSQGTQRKVLMMDPGSLGRIIKAGDCVGKEKAVVKEIGNGYLTFQLVPEVQPGQTPHPEEHSYQLHEKDLDVSGGDLSQPSPEGPEITPVLPTGPSPTGKAPVNPDAPRPGNGGTATVPRKRG